MSDIRLEVLPGTYSNDDAYDKVLSYIFMKDSISGYGIILNDSLTIVEQYQASEFYSIHSHQQKIWHFIITFSDHPKMPQLFHIANTTALTFVSQYQVLYGIDSTGHSTHLHFGVNAFSYHPEVPALTTDTMKQYMESIRMHLLKEFPHKSVTLQFQGKKPNCT